MNAFKRFSTFKVMDTNQIQIKDYLFDGFKHYFQCKNFLALNLFIQIISHYRLINEALSLI